jgi:hypothetical protein
MTSFEKRQESTPTKEDMLKNREAIFRNKEIINDSERIEQMQEVDYGRASSILINEERYNEYQGNATSQIQEVFQKQAEQQLVETLRGAHYRLTPGMEYIEAEQANDQSVAFRIAYDGVEALKEEGVFRFKLRVFEPYETGAHHVEHVAVVDVNIIDGTARTVVVPEGIALERPRMLLPPSSDTGLLSAKTTIALEKWLKIPKFIPRAASDNAVTEAGAPSISQEEGIPPPVELVDEMESTLMFRRRTITPGNLSNIESSLSSLVGSWSPEEIRVLEEAGGGAVRLRLFANFGEGDTQQFQELPAQPEATDIASIDEVVNVEFLRGAKDVTVACLGSWIEREYRNLSPGPTHRPHLRRVREKIILALNRDSSPALREVQRKFNSGNTELSADEKALLKGMLAVDDEQLMVMLEEKGITFKDGSFSPNPSDTDQISPTTYFRRAA